MTAATPPATPPAREILTFTGDLDTTDFLQWAAHRARKLGLVGRARCVGNAVEVDVTGPLELIDAMALCCSLGPASSWIETVERTAAAPLLQPATGFSTPLAT